jgi:hypothetical protein
MDRTGSSGRARTGRMALVALLAVMTASHAACAAGEAGAPANGAEKVAVREVVVRTVDHRFEMPDTLEAGITRIRLVNDGPDFHHVWLIRLESGTNEGEVLSELAAHRPLPAGAIAAGGPNTPGVPGGETNATVDLEPGEYLVVCVIPGMHDGELHVAKGMVGRLTVVPSVARGELPQADVVLTLDDYSYELSEPLRSGRQAIRIVNVAQQAHEVVFVKLEPGRTVADFLGFLQAPEGPPPGLMIGGVTWLGRDESNVVELELESGEYGLLCFVPDEGDGRLHLEHGMVRQLRVD